MTLHPSSSNTRIEASIQDDHFAWLHAKDMKPLLQAAGGLEDWEAFAASWNNLPSDWYMADGGRYRQRRHAAFAVRRGKPVEPKPAQPHFQSRDRNPLNGGIERWFEPVLPEVSQSSTLHAIFTVCRELLERLRPEITAWHTELHQFRILARSGEPGQPTPEGMHRDGVDFVCVLLVQRTNVQSGTTTIADLDREIQGEFTLADPLDAAFVDDRYAYHGVTAILPENPVEPAYRDVLVVTWKADPPA